MVVRVVQDQGIGGAQPITSTGRLETFADGVFAIAITLLVLEIHIPDPGEDLVAGLAAQWPSFLAYVTSFLTIGTMWANHHRLFTAVRGTTYGFLFVNVLLLMPIAFLPYPTAVLARHFDAAGRLPAALLYGGTMALIAIGFSLVWWYAGRRGLLDEGPALAMSARRRGFIVYRVAPLIYLVGALGAAWNPLIAVGVFLAMAIYWALPNL